MSRIFKFSLSKVRATYVYQLTFTNVTEYLKYKTYYRGVTKDWNARASRFMQLEREEINCKNATEASRLMELYWSVSRFFLSTLNIRVTTALDRYHEITDSLNIHTMHCFKNSGKTA
jgi:hypothetical protein